MSEVLLVPAAFALTVVLTGVARAYALRHRMLDVPNSRSSHSTPTPRGGGAAFCLVFFAYIGWKLATDAQALRLGVALLGGGALLAVIGWQDDRHTLTPLTRAVVHLAVAVWALVWLGGLPSLCLGTGRVELGLVGSVLAAVGIVWLINLYNFMDGIDGIAAGQAVATAGAAGLLLSGGGSSLLAGLAWVLAAACAGFLVWNWAPAKVFMGDVGSGVLGYSFAVMALASESQGALPLLLWVLLLGVFAVDATATLLSRLQRGERWYEPHRSHAYQRAVQSGRSHARVTLSVIGLDVLLAALAGVAWRWPASLLPIFLAAMAGLLVIWRWGRRLAPLAAEGSWAVPEPVGPGPAE